MIQRFVSAMMVFAAMCGAPALTQTPDAGQLPFELKSVGPGVFAAIDTTGKAGSNAGFIIGDDSVVVVDSFSNTDAAKALLGEIRKATPKPVKYVINTHYHYDHVGGDAVFAEAGAIIIAQHNVHAWIKTENPNLFGGKLTPAQQARLDAFVEPNLTVDTGMTLWLGGRRVEVRYEKGHTGGDLVVSIPDAYVMFCGDLLWRKFSPNVIDGTISDWIATDAGFEKTLAAMKVSFVPGHGDVANLADVGEFKTYLITLKDLTSAGRKRGLKGADLVADVLPKMKEKYGSWAAFNTFAPKEVGFMEDELNGKKRTPKPAP